MINRLVVAMLFAVFVVEYLVRERGLLHPFAILLPELLSAIAMIVVLTRITAGARVALDWRYLLFMLLLVFTMIFGFVVQEVPSGAVVAGIRAHLKFLPFFLLPLVYRFRPEELRTQFVVLLGLLLAQAPLAVYQRFVEFADRMHTGDPVKGTTTASSSLSMLLICGIGVVVAMYLRRRIGLLPALGLIGILFLPTTINETKATLLLLPVALVLPALLMPRGSRRVGRLVPVLAVGGIAAAAFVATYDFMIQHRTNGEPIAEYFTRDQLMEYLNPREAGGNPEAIGRFDSIEIALERNAVDPMRLAFGLGAGNVSASFLPQFDGEYAAYFQRFGVDQTQITNFLWQIGLVGLGLYLALYYFVIRDSWYLARYASGGDAVLGQAWLTVMAVMTFALIYKSIFGMNEIGYLFWLYSGVVASRAFEQRCRAPRRQRVRPGRRARPAAAGDSLPAC